LKEAEDDVSTERAAVVVVGANVICCRKKFMASTRDLESSIILLFLLNERTDRTVRNNNRYKVFSHRESKKDPRKAGKEQSRGKQLI
jgi:hypothetical protein